MDDTPWPSRISLECKSGSTCENQCYTWNYQNKEKKKTHMIISVQSKHLRKFNTLSRASLVVSWWRICLQCRRPRFDSWVGKIPWRRKWQPAPVFLPEESYGQRSLAGYSRWGRKSQAGLKPPPQHSFLIETCSTVGTEGKFLSIVKATYEKPTMNIILSDERLESSFSEFRNTGRMC